MLFQDLLYAAPDLKAPVFRQETVSLDASSGVVQDAFHAPSSTKTLYLLQDAHTNESAQRSIAAVLETLVHKEKLRYVFLEAGTGDDSLSDLRVLASPKDRKHVADIHLRRAHLQGADYLDLTSELDLQLWGVEDKALYFRGIELYRSLRNGREGADAWLEKLERAIQSLKPRLFHAALLEFDRARQAHLSGELDLEAYTGLLQKKAAELSVPTDLLRNVRLLSEVRTKGSQIDFEAPEDEDMQRYLEYAGLASKIKPEDLLTEIAWLEEKVYLSLIGTTDEKALLDAAKKRETLGRLVHLQATSEDIAALEADPASFDAAALGGFLNARIMELERHYEDAIFLDERYQRTFDDARAFYALTQERDRHFVSAILEKMGEAKVSEAAFVAGGFHTENLKRLLKEKNVSYVSIVPKVTGETNQRRYEDLLLAQAPRTAPMPSTAPVKMWNTLPAAELQVAGLPVRSMRAAPWHQVERQRRIRGTAGDRALQAFHRGAPDRTDAPLGVGGRGADRVQFILR
jgi:hypothetical protein